MPITTASALRRIAWTLAALAAFKTFWILGEEGWTRQRRRGPSWSRWVCLSSSRAPSSSQADGPASASFRAASPREREVLALIGGGHSNAYIADHVVLSLKTVRNSVSNVLTKLGVATRAEAVVVARRAGLGRGEGDTA